MLSKIIIAVYLWAAVVIFIRLGVRVENRYENETFDMCDYIVGLEFPRYTASLLLLFGGIFLIDIFAQREIPVNAVSTVLPVLSLMLIASLGFSEIRDVFPNLRKELKLYGQADVQNSIVFFTRCAGGLFMLVVAFGILGFLAHISLSLLLI